MRSDMGKIVIDAYRHNSRWEEGSLPRRQPKHRKHVDERPNKVSMTRTKWGSKYLGDNLSPLYRWLDKQVGRRWDDVYAEVTHTLRGGFTNMDHIRGHLYDRLQTNEVRMIDGWPHAQRQFGYMAAEWLPLRKEELYVDHRGVIRRPPASRHDPRNHQASPRIVRIDGATVAARVDGTWWRADLERVPTKLERCSMPDANGKLIRSDRRIELRFEDAFYPLVSAYRTWNGTISHRVSHPVPIGPDDRERLYGDRNLYAYRVTEMSKKEILQRIPERNR